MGFVVRLHLGSHRDPENERVHRPHRFLVPRHCLLPASRWAATSLLSVTHCPSVCVVHVSGIKQRTLRGVVAFPQLDFASAWSENRDLLVPSFKAH